MFDFLFDSMFVVVPMFILAVFIFIGYRLISQKIKDDRSPIIKTEATVVAKRTNISTSTGLHHSGTRMHHHHHTSTSTSYYVTFEMANGERKEFHVWGEEYGLIVENDYGYLTYQGSRFKGFEIIS
ncbi:MAG TPA: DUF2500 domain-containing protein [Erysipelotrichaceae bacterium]|jgi:hypothetical protein|nr:DUF2500 domain-containing protein [Erysipelotrichia bacterium]HPX32072.1 DUF2500 domain-containing protein [Erysipelotrichaceae bacterium]HQA84887.1 DUF2500 domain-containing protein [Erysipelotrichaceae bacterium]